MDPADILREAARESAQAAQAQQVAATEAARRIAQGQAQDPEIDGIVRLFAARMEGAPTVPLWSRLPRQKSVARWSPKTFWRQSYVSVPDESETPIAHGWLFTPGTDYFRYGRHRDLIDTYDNFVETYQVYAVTPTGILYLVVVNTRPESYEPDGPAHLSDSSRFAGPWDGISRYTLASWSGYSVATRPMSLASEPDPVKREARMYLADSTDQLLPRFHLEIGAGLAAVLTRHGKSLT